MIIYVESESWPRRLCPVRKWTAYSRLQVERLQSIDRLIARLARAGTHVQVGVDKVVDEEHILRW